MPRRRQPGAAVRPLLTARNNSFTTTNTLTRASLLIVGMNPGETTLYQYAVTVTTLGLVTPPLFEGVVLRDRDGIHHRLRVTWDGKETVTYKTLCPKRVSDDRYPDIQQGLVTCFMCITACPTPHPINHPPKEPP